MSQFEFDEILKKYLAGQISPEEEKLILRWYKSFINESTTHISAQEKKEIEARIFGKLKEKISRSPEILGKAPRPIFYSRWFKYAAACIFLLILVRGFFVFHTAHKFIPPNNAFTHIKIPSNLQSVYNDNSKSIRIKLADGSTVELEPKSKLLYPKNFTGITRNVYLAGNAFFKVMHDSKRHFIVHTDEGLLTEVLGTSFYVLHNKNLNQTDQVEVNVVTGKVYVYKEDNFITTKKTSSKRILLTPNQCAKFNSKNNQFSVSLVDDPKPVESDEEFQAPAHVAFSYNDVKLSDILKDISNTYGISVQVDNQKLNNCHFTGDLGKQPLYQKLNILCEATESSYEVKGTSIIIKGEGCD